MFRANVFAVYDCGFRPRSALEVSNSAQTRIDKILDIVGESKFGIHDISRTQCSGVPRLPRFNMPLELGIFLGAKRFGASEHKMKNCLVFDSDSHRYQRFISDIAGQDIASHANDPRRLISEIRNWLSDTSGRRLPGGREIAKRFDSFHRFLPETCRKASLDLADLTFRDLCGLIEEWLEIVSPAAQLAD